MQVLFDLARQRNRLAMVAKRLKCVVEPLSAFFQPVLDLDVVVAAVSLIRIQLVRAVDRNCFLHISEEFLEIDNVPVIFIGAVQPVRAANRLKQV